MTNTLPTIESVAAKLAATPPSLFAADEVRTVFAELAIDRHRAETAEARLAEVVRERDEAELESNERDQKWNECAMSLVRIHTWLGKTIEQRSYRGDFNDCEGLIEDAYAEASERVRL